MKVFVLFALLGCLTLPLFGQNNYTAASQSDPEARQLLESIRKKYDAYRTLTADFRLDLAFPGQALKTQRGSLSRQGELVHFKLGNQEGIINETGGLLHPARQ